VIRSDSKRIIFQWLTESRSEIDSVLFRTRDIHLQGVGNQERLPGVLEWGGFEGDQTMIS